MQKYKLKLKHKHKQGHETMEPKLWSQLPEDLLYRILSLLPIQSLISLRPTCKLFHSLLFNPSFLSLLSPSPSPPSLLLSHPQFSPHHLPLFSPSSDIWRSLSIPQSHPHLLSSSSGILLFSSSFSLLLLNPLTLSSRFLSCPCPPSLSSTLVLTSNGYTIILPSPNPNLLFLYNSQSMSWSSLRSPALPHSPQKPAFFDGCLYFTTHEPFSIARLCLSSRDWLPSPIDLPSDLAFARIVSSDGKGLFLVGGVGQDGISRSLKVWEMVQGGWEEVGRLPDMMMRKFVSVCYHNYSHVYCLCHEGIICVCCTTWPEVLFFKVLRGTWHWLPRCPSLQEKWSCGFRWFSFVPDLFAMV
ncbi:F-box domain-containing protein [Dioscorea alata]|uniref:F-box domain-containing protein n=1 Tax=Dioscorea alata TaxID=55571 RepID=A0ACB7UWU8_DIOAL|nr:F-box domain-containing protein [Dioscorea alata]